MFGGFANKLPGGYARMHQAFTQGAITFKGPADANLVIAAGDRFEAIGTFLTTGWSLTLQGGKANGIGTASVAANGGPVIIKGADAGTTNGIGGSVTINSGLSSATSSANITIQAGDTNNGAASLPGSVTIKGGGHVNGIGGSVTLLGGNGGGGTGSGQGGLATLQAGTTSSGAGGIAQVLGSAGSVNFAGGKVLIQPGAAGGGSGAGLANGHIVLDGGRGAALSTTAIGGFVCMPSCAGAPTGTPNAIPTGMVPIVLDTTNAKFWAYIGGAWKGIVLI
jgi:hypothetical protein